MFTRLIIPLLCAMLVVACNNQASQSNPMNSDLAKTIDAFKNRKIYNRLSPDILAKIPDDELDQAIMDYVEIKIAGRYDQQSKIIATLNLGIQALFVTWWVDTEVNNGGFNQYYWNSAGGFADVAPKAFDYFGARQHAELMREANEVRRAESSTIQKYKDQGSLEAFSASYSVSKLGPLDKRFYALTENLHALRIAKIRAHPEDFSGD